MGEIYGKYSAKTRYLLLIAIIAQEFACYLYLNPFPVKIQGCEVLRKKKNNARSRTCHTKLQRPLTMKHSTFYYQGDIYHTHAFYIGTYNFSTLNEIKKKKRRKKRDFFSNPVTF